MRADDLTDAGRARLDWYVTHRTGRDACRTRHLGLCGRVDKSGSAATTEGWDEIHPAFRCAACDWILRGAANPPPRTHHAANEHGDCPALVGEDPRAQEETA